MNTVEPIRDKEIVKDISDYLFLKNRRDHLMFNFGIYSGLRISDILPFRVRDVKGKDRIMMREKKTGKEKYFPINKELQKIIKNYILGMNDYDFLFSNPSSHKSITRQQAYNIMAKVGDGFGIEKMGTHTLRKTFGYHIYQKTRDAAMLMDIFNHSTVQVTLRYIGVNQDTKDKTYNALSFK